MAPLRDAEDWLAHYRPFWDETLASLARYAEQGQAKVRRKRRSHP